MKTSLLVMALLLGTSLSAHAGKTVEREAARGSTKSSGSGTNVGGGNGVEYSAKVTWCQDKTSLLRNYRDRAERKLENKGDYNAANKILTTGIVRILSEADHVKETFFHKSLVRGLEIANHLGAQSVLEARKSMVTHYILKSYYDFIIEIAANTDLNTLPYLGRHSHEMNSRAAQYEVAFVRYAKSQIDWLLANLVRDVRLVDKIQIVPVGDADSVLKVALTISKGAAEDLDESLYNSYYACSISSLNLLNETLTEAEQGNTEMFDDKKQALEYAAKELRRINGNITPGVHCR